MSDTFPSDAHLIDDGNVGCPVRGRDVDIDSCYACGAFQGLDGIAPEDSKYLVCRPAASMVPLSMSEN